MKFHENDKVIFLKRSDKQDGWPLKNYEEYTITDVASDTMPESKYFYGVKDKKGDHSTWYNEDDFLTLKEYRKLKLKKINENKNRQY